MKADGASNETDNVSGEKIPVQATKKGRRWVPKAEGKGPFSKLNLSVIRGEKEFLGRLCPVYGQMQAEIEGFKKCLDENN